MEGFEFMKQYLPEEVQEEEEMEGEDREGIDVDDDLEK